MENNKNKPFAFTKTNYMWMLIGLGVIILGLVVMSMGDRSNFGFDFVGITLGPLIVLAGFTLEFFAIFRKEKEQ